MNCSQTQAMLPLLLYGDLDGKDAVVTEKHLAECEACNIVFKELSRVRELLDCVPAHDMPVDFGRFLPAVSPANNQTPRPWGQYAFWATSAVLFIALLLNFEVRFEKHQLIVRWGNVPLEEHQETIVPSESEPIPLVDDSLKATEGFQERIRVLDELVHALSDQVNAHDSEQHDSEQHDRLTALQARLHLLEKESREYREQANRSVAALYAACFPNPSQGEIP